MITDIIEGKGYFNTCDFSIEKNFKIVFYPRQTYIEIMGDPIIQIFDDCEWRLNGYLDDGTIVESNDFFPTRFGEFFVNEVTIGESITHSNVSSFPLVGYYKSKFSFGYNGYEIKVAEEKDVDEESRFYRRTGTMREGVTLKIIKQNHSIADSFEIALSITRLLSIVTGNNVVFNKRIFDDKYTVHRRSVFEDSSFKNVIPYEWIGEYFQSAIKAWNEFDTEDKKLFENITSYLNSAGGSGYLDERMFKVAQSWEMAASKWSNNNVSMPDGILDLKRRLKSTWKEWRTYYPEIDKEGFLNSRILNSLEWDSFINKVERLAKDFEIDNTKLNLNFRLLKNNVRDKVAHEGRMIPFDNAHDLLTSLKFGLKLILLKKLNYKGEVFYHENKYTRNFKINHFFKDEMKIANNKV